MLGDPADKASDLCDFNTAQAPATCGADIDVPDLMSNDLPAGKNFERVGRQHSIELAILTSVAADIMAGL